MGFRKLSFTAVLPRQSALLLRECSALIVFQIDMVTGNGTEVCALVFPFVLHNLAKVDMDVNVN